MNPKDINHERDLLILARERIATEDRWTKGAYEKSNDEGEVCYCALGATFSVSDAMMEGPWDGVLTGRAARLQGFATVRLQAQLPKPFRNIPVFNDHPDTTHADVLALFDRAIEAAGC